MFTEDSKIFKGKNERRKKKNNYQEENYNNSVLTSVQELVKIQK